MNSYKQDQKIKSFESILKRSGLFLAGVMVFFAATGIVMPASMVMADKLTLNVDSVGYYVQMSSTTGETLNINATPNENNVSEAVDTINIKTNVDNGYSVFLSTKGDDNSLKLANAPSGANADTVKIKPLGGQVNRNNFTVNSWGYSIDDGQSWNKVPQKGQEVKIKGETNATSDEGTTFNVKYGTKVNTGIVSGSYSGEVVYTVVADGSSADLQGSVTPTSVNAGTEITVTVPLYVNYQVGGEEVRVTVGGEVCSNVRVDRQDKNSMSIKCNVPAKVDGEDKEVKVYLPKNGSLPVNAGNVRYQ